jgi:hypothetical protein
MLLPSCLGVHATYLPRSFAFRAWPITTKVSRIADTSSAFARWKCFVISSGVNDSSAARSTFETAFTHSTAFVEVKAPLGFRAVTMLLAHGKLEGVAAGEGRLRMRDFEHVAEFGEE